MKYAFNNTLVDMLNDVLTNHDMLQREQDRGWFPETHALVQKYDDKIMDIIEQAAKSNKERTAKGSKKHYAAAIQYFYTEIKYLQQQINELKKEIANDSK